MMVQHFPGPGVLTSVSAPHSLWKTTRFPLRTYDCFLGCHLCLRHRVCNIQGSACLDDHLSTWPLWQVELHLRLRVPHVGHYVVLLEYATEVDQLSVVDVKLKSPGSALAGQVNIYSCKYR